MPAPSLARFGLLLALAMSVLSLPAFGQTERQPSDDQRAALEARLEETRDRLGLTPAQEEAVRPILINSLEEGARILQRYGFDGETRPDLSFRERRALRVDLKALRQKTDASLATVLTPEQIAEYDRIRDERKDELRARIQSRR